MLDSRRAIRFPQPNAQLRLPLYLSIMTLGFALFLGWHTREAFQGIYAMVMSVAPESFEGEINAQARDYVIVSAAILGGYAFSVIILCVAYIHKLVGPTVALRRQVQELKNGNYGSQVALRKGDGPFEGLASDLNDLTHLLSQRHSSQRAG